MIISLGTCNDDKRVVHKTVDLSPVKGDILTPTSILYPSVKIRHYINCNYAYISDFNRYYFVTEIFAENGYCVYNLTIDVLKTYENEINNINAYVVRNEYINNNYTVDNLLPLLDNKQVIRHNVGTPLEIANNDNIFLLTI